MLKKLGLEDCFDTVICFENLNPPSSSSREDNSANIFDVIGYLSKPDPDVDLPKTSILCKPSVEAMEHALRIANIDPQRTVSCISYVICPSPFAGFRMLVDVVKSKCVLDFF